MAKFSAIDVIAIVIIVCCFWLYSRGIDTYLQGILALVVGYYFGRKHEVIRAELELKK